jgi:endonuclease/exonuclease/phosphatase family metal-dependent hydrolase
LIDVALISKIPFDYVITHQYQRTKDNKAFMFSRDCLEVKFTIEGKPFYVFVNHFKSMLDQNDPANGRKNTAPRRKEQAQAVADILIERLGANPGNANWIVLGDLNDYPDKTSSLKPLIENPWIENVIQTRLPEADSWTHFWDTSSKKVSQDEKYKQIDYLLLSKQLADKNKNVKPVIIRKGLCLDADRYTGSRYSGIGKKRPAASDHCPVAITIDI